MSYFKAPLSQMPREKISSAQEVFGSGWFFLRWEVWQQERAVVEGLRERFSLKIRREFRRAARRTLPAGFGRTVQRNHQFWHVHHIIPLALGGDNKRLALVHDEAHRLIHLYLKPQIEGLCDDERRIVLIPVRFDLVWSNKGLPESLKARLRPAA